MQRHLEKLEQAVVAKFSWLHHQARGMQTGGANLEAPICSRWQHEARQSRLNVCQFVDKVLGKQNQVCWSQSSSEILVCRRTVTHGVPVVGEGTNLLQNCLDGAEVGSNGRDNIAPISMSTTSCPSGFAAPIVMSLGDVGASIPSMASATAGSSQRENSRTTATALALSCKVASNSFPLE